MSKAKFASLLLGGILVTVPAVVLHAETATPQRVGLSSARLQRVHELVDRTIAAGEISGAVTLVARNGQVAYLEAQGFMDLATKKPMQADSMFRLASMSKPVAAVAILTLAEEGKVRLSDPVSRFIPAYANLEVGIAKPAAPGPGGPPAAAQGGSGAAPPFLLNARGRVSLTLGAA
jgi:CubicO group peptidase (beta-lactamase class C family)